MKSCQAHFISLPRYGESGELTDQTIFSPLRTRIQRGQSINGTLQIVSERTCISIESDLGHSITFFGPLQQRRRIQGRVAMTQRQAIIDYEHETRTRAATRQRRLHSNIRGNGEQRCCWKRNGRFFGRRHVVGVPQRRFVQRSTSVLPDAGARRGRWRSGSAMLVLYFLVSPHRAT